MFEQYDVHNCNKTDDMKNITRPCSCDLSFDKKARPRKRFLDNTGLFSRLHSKCSFNNWIGDKRNARLDPKLDAYLGNKPNHVWTYHSGTNTSQERYSQQNPPGSYPRWFENTVRYLFSKQLRKCFDLA